MSNTYLLSPEADRVYLGQLGTDGSVRRLIPRQKLPSGTEKDWTDANWLKDLRQKLEIHDAGSWLITYPLCSWGTQYRGFEAALKAGGFESPQAVADVDAVISFYKARQPLPDDGSTLIVMLGEEYTRLILPNPNNSHIFYCSPGDDGGFSELPQQEKDRIKQILPAGESPKDHDLLSYLQTLLPGATVCAASGMEHAVSAGLEKLAPVLVPLNSTVDKWLNVRDGSENLTGLLLDKYASMIKEAIEPAFYVSRYLNESLKRWVNCHIRSGQIIPNMKQQAEDYYLNTCCESICSALRQFRREYEDYIHRLLGDVFPAIRIDPSPLEKTADWLFDSEFLSLLTVHCIPFPNYLSSQKDQSNLLDLITGARKDRLPEIRKTVSQIDIDHFALSQCKRCIFDTSRFRHYQSAFAVEALDQVQALMKKTITEKFSGYVNIQKQLADRLGSVNHTSLHTALAEVESNKCQPGKNIIWIEEKDETETESASSYWDDISYYGNYCEGYSGADRVG